MRVRSAGLRSRLSDVISLATKSNMLRRERRRAARSSNVPPTPNSFSNATRGSRMTGSGSVGDDQLIESV